MTAADYELDVRNLNCPLPILHAKKKLQNMESGETVWVYVTDPGAVKDFTAHAEHSGDELLETREVGNEYHFLLRKSV